MKLIQINTPHSSYFKEFNNRICTIVGICKSLTSNRDLIVVSHSRRLLWDRSGVYSKTAILQNPDFKMITNDFEHGVVLSRADFCKIDYRIRIS